MLIDNKIIRRIKKESKEREDKLFVVLAYDFPSEFRNDDDVETKSKYKSRRLSVGRNIMLNGVRLNNSVYIMHEKRVMKVVDYIERTYHDMLKEINVKLVGTVYQDVAEKFIVDAIEEKLSDIKDELDSIEVALEDYQEGKIDEDSMKTYRNKTYLLSHKMNCLEARVDDLKVLNENKSERYSRSYLKLEEFRGGVVAKIKAEFK